METIAGSLVKFQSKLKPINKDAENPFFKSDYVTLSGIIDAILPLLVSCEMSLTQPMRVDGDKTILITKIVHSSGEFIQSEMILPQHPDPQKYGSLITYYKRYQLQALLGISTKDEDDDGNSVGSQNNYTEQNYAAGKALKDLGKTITDQQSRAIYAISKANNIEAPKINTFEEASAFIDKMNKKGK